MFAQSMKFNSLLVFFPSMVRIASSIPHFPFPGNNGRRDAPRYYPGDLRPDPASNLHRSGWPLQMDRTLLSKPNSFIGLDLHATLYNQFNLCEENYTIYNIPNKYFSLLELTVKNITVKTSFNTNFVINNICYNSILK